MYRRILRLNAGNNARLVVALLLQFLLSGVVVLSSEVLRRAVNAVEQKDLSFLTPIVVAGVAVTLVNMALQYLAGVSMQRATNAAEKQIQCKIVDRLTSLTLPSARRYGSGDILTRLTQNAPEAISQGIGSAQSLIEGFSSTAFCCVYMCVLSLPLALCMLSYNILVRVLVPWFNRKIKAIQQQLVAQNTSSNSFMVQLLHNMLAVRAFGKEKYFEEQFVENEAAICKNGLKIFAWSNGASEVIWVTKKIAEVAILFGVGGLLVHGGSIGFGVIAAFTTVSDTFGKALNALVEGFSSRAQALPNLDAVTAFLSEGEAEGGAREPAERLDGEIRFEHVSFSYPGRPVLEDVSFTIPAGAKVLVTGGNGEGKSTILKLICGLYRPQAGRITIGGRDTGGLHIDAIAARCVYIPQAPLLFEGDLYDNIAFPDDTDEDEGRRLQREFLLEGVAPETPQSFSQGEKQRCCIARGVRRLRGKAVLLGDEVFANVDAANKQNIADILFSEGGAQTQLLICHEAIRYPFDMELTVSGGQARLRAMAGEARA